MVAPGSALFPLPDDFLRWLIATLGRRKREALAIIGLDERYCWAADTVIEGTSNATSTSYRTIMGEAIRSGAKALIVAHNHPSHSPHPSAIDISSTRDLCALARPLEIEIVDHIIVTRVSAFSMRKAGMLGHGK